jgi:hypothetical protein
VYTLPLCLDIYISFIYNYITHRLLRLLHTTKRRPALHHIAYSTTPPFL